MQNPIPNPEINRMLFIKAKKALMPSVIPYFLEIFHEYLPRIYRGLISNAFHVARDSATNAAEDKTQKISQSDMDTSEDTPYIMFMFRTAKEQRSAEQVGVVALLKNVSMRELRKFPCVSHLLQKVDICIRNEEENYDETWVGSRYGGNS
ncbi:hypothetical protein [Undibacterium sp. Ren11W]|uniref:hypothetical protein n=1 Tax=Undibacterium sp. Ren11W TaxID=3413045 RepID=UPI003BEF5187